MSINNVNISGNIVKDCERKGSKDNPLVLFTVAVNERYTNKDGEKVENTSYIDCKCFGKYAQVVADSLVKGTRVAVSGKLVQDKWETEDGEKRSKVTVQVSTLETFKPKREDDSDSSAW